MRFTDHPLLTESLVITKPLVHRPRWPGAAAVMLHVAAAGGMVASGLHAPAPAPEPEPMTRVIIHPPTRSAPPAGTPDSGNGRGGGNPDGGKPPREIKVPPRANSLTPPAAPIPEQPATPDPGTGTGLVEAQAGSGEHPEESAGYTGKGGDPTAPAGVPGGDVIILPYLVSDPPRVTQRIEPIYPENARTMGLSGRVILQFIIESDGSVSDIQIVEASNGLFREPALQAARRWKFTAAAMDGRKVRTYKTVVMKFELS